MTQVQFHMLNWVDYAIIAVVLFSMLISFMRGFFKEVVSIIVWGAALVLSFVFAERLGQHFTSVASPHIRYALAFVSILIVTLIAGVILNAVVSVVVNKGGISVVDRGLGLFFGAGRGIALVAVALMLCQFTGFASSAVKQSRLAVRFTPMVKWLDSYVPEKINAIAAHEKGVGQIKKTLHSVVKEV